MTTLNERLRALREKGEQNRAPEITAILRAVRDELRASDILSGVPAVGDRAPLFARPNLVGKTVRLSAILKQGPAVVSFFRGRW